VKVTGNAANRVFASGHSGVSPRSVETEIEPVYTTLADGEYPAVPQDRAEEAFDRRKLGLGPPDGRERRRQERRQRQVRVLLDTRVAQSRRQNPSIDESA
jgi:hypothetical protein